MAVDFRGHGDEAQRRLRIEALHFRHRRLARERRRLLYWSYDSLDYQRRPPAELVAAMRARPPRPGDVMLMHDDGDCCIGMLETLLPQWRSEGFEFRALPTGADVDATVEGARA